MARRYLDTTGGGGFLDAGTNLDPLVPADGTQNITGALTTTGAITSNGHMVWTTDNTYDIGASGATRPRSAYFGTTVKASTFDATGSTINGALWSGANITMNATGTTYSMALQVNSITRWEIAAGASIGNLICTADNAYDIGASGANRPRNLYLAGAAAIGGDVTLAAGADLVLATTTGTMIGTGTTQLLGFYGAAPSDQGASIADATDAASVITACNAVISRLEELGLIATV